jgi:hypothetical protein
MLKTIELKNKFVSRSFISFFAHNNHTSPSERPRQTFRLSHTAAQISIRRGLKITALYHNRYDFAKKFTTVSFLSSF